MSVASTSEATLQNARSASMYVQLSLRQKELQKLQTENRKALRKTEDELLGFVKNVDGNAVKVGDHLIRYSSKESVVAPKKKDVMDVVDKELSNISGAESISEVRTKIKSEIEKLAQKKVKDTLRITKAPKGKSKKSKKVVQEQNDEVEEVNSEGDE